MREPRTTRPMQPAHSRVLWVAALLTGIALLCYFRLHDFGAPIFFADDYVQRSKNTWLQLTFYTADRPFTTDLFYKVWGSTAAGALLGNQIFSVGCWTFLGWCLGSGMRRPMPGLAVLFLGASASLWWNIAGWTQVMLSESITFSLFALWYGFILLLSRRPRVSTLTGLALVTFFFSFCKDSVAYFLLGFALAAALWFSLHRKPRALHPFWFTYLGMVILLFALQSATARVKHRYAFPLINVLLQRVLPHEDRVRWFLDHGAPLEALLGESPNWKGAWASSHEWALYGEARYAEFKQWVFGPGRNTYARFLLSQPRETLKSAWRDRREIYSYGLVAYTRPPPPSLPIRLANWLWHPSRTFLVFGVLLVYLLIWPFGSLPTLPLLLAAGSLGHGLFIYHADAMEIQRHCLLVAVGLQVAFFQALVSFSVWLNEAFHRRKRSTFDPSTRPKNE